MSLTKNMAYDHPSYTARAGQFSSIMTAGSGGVSAKFTAYANMLLFGLTYYTTVVGTSTYSTGLTNNLQGATKAVASTQVSVIRITNTAAAGATAALSTSTYGPFTVGGNFVTSGTATNQVGAFESFQIAGQGTATNSSGGVAINAGDQIYVVNGTDATAVGLVSIDYAVAPLASVTA